MRKTEYHVGPRENIFLKWSFLKKYCEIAKRCPDKISSVVKVSSFSL